MSTWQIFGTVIVGAFLLGLVMSLVGFLARSFASRQLAFTGPTINTEGLIGSVIAAGVLVAATAWALTLYRIHKDPRSLLDHGWLAEHVVNRLFLPILATGFMSSGPVTDETRLPRWWFVPPVVWFVRVMRWPARIGGFILFLAIIMLPEMVLHW